MSRRDAAGRQELGGISIRHPQAFTYLQQRFQSPIANGAPGNSAPLPPGLTPTLISEGVAFRFRISGRNRFKAPLQPRKLQATWICKYPAKFSLSRTILTCGFRRSQLRRRLLDCRVIYNTFLEEYS